MRRRRFGVEEAYCSSNKSVSHVVLSRLLILLLCFFVIFCDGHIRYTLSDGIHEYSHTHNFVVYGGRVINIYEVYSLWLGWDLVGLGLIGLGCFGWCEVD